MDDSLRAADDSRKPADDSLGAADDPRRAADDSRRPADDSLRAADDSRKPADDPFRGTVSFQTFALKSAPLACFKPFYEKVCSFLRLKSLPILPISPILTQDFPSRSPITNYLF